MRSAITVSLVPEASGGPFVFWNGLADAFEKAAALGFDAVEIFPPSAEALDISEIRELCKRHALKVAAVGTGAGWVLHQLHLCHPDIGRRRAASDFIYRIIEKAAQLGAPAIIGSMQGRIPAGVPREKAMAWFGELLGNLGADANAEGQTLLIEPLNRYETNVFNRVPDLAAFLQTAGSPGLEHVRILADLFHMNIEEADIAASLRDAGPLIGHVHFADSNRRAIGFGHTAAAPVIEALREIDYRGYLSAEALPLPDSATAAQQTMDSFRRHTPGKHPTEYPTSN